MLQLYKYKSLNDIGFNHFIDIILNERIYASSFKELREYGNDKKEGTYYPIILDETMLEIFNKEVLDKKSKLKICCLSKDGESDEMWKEYADDYKGVVVVVEKKKNDQCFEIKYNEDFPDFLESELMKHEEVAKKILSNKRTSFSYEKEMRIFTNGNRYVKVKVNEVIIGKEMTSENFDFIKMIVSKINPTIKVKRQEKTI